MDSLLQRAKVSRPMYYDAGGRLGNQGGRAVTLGIRPEHVLPGDGPDALIARAQALGYDTSMLRITQQP